MPTTIASLYDGPRITVSTIVQQPSWIQARILRGLQNTFLMEQVFRNGGPMQGSLVGYYESTPLYAEMSDAPDVGEFAEIPVTRGSLGLPRITVATKKAFGVRISKEMVDENQMDVLMIQIQQVINTMRRTWLRAMLAVLRGGQVPTINASASWATPSTNIRGDVAVGMETVRSAVPPASQGDDTLEFEPDVICLHPSKVTNLISSSTFNVPILNSPGYDQNPALTGKLPPEIMGLRTLYDRSWPTTEVLIAESKTIGFWRDARSLMTTPTYPEGNGPNGGPTESWRSDTSRKTACGLDQPLAGVRVLSV